MVCRWSSAIQIRMRILPCFQSGGKIKFESWLGKIKFGSWPWLSRLEDLRARILMSGKMCGLYQWEFKVNSHTRTDQERVQEHLLTISFPLSLILRERGAMSCPSFSPLIFCSYWQLGGRLFHGSIAGSMRLMPSSFLRPTERTMRDLKLLFFERKTCSAFWCVPAAVCVGEMLSTTLVLASKGLASPSKLGSMVDVNRVTWGTWIGQWSGGEETMCETMFFFSVQVCLDPWTVLCQADLQRYLFWGTKGMFLCFYVQKIVPVDTLLLYHYYHTNE